MLKISEMGENIYRLNQRDFKLKEVMTVHCEGGVFPSPYPCPEFMNAAGISQDFQTLVSNAGLEYFY